MSHGETTESAKQTELDRSELKLIAAAAGNVLDSERAIFLLTCAETISPPRPRKDYDRSRKPAWLK